MRASICLATRNKADYLARVLESIRCQKVPFDYEIIVADDGSTDNTVAVCEQYGALREYLDNPRYRNPAIARNAAYRAARGDVIIAQSDDVMHISPDTIRRLVEDLKPGEAIIPTVYNMQLVGGEWKKCHVPLHVYSGPARAKPFFFLGSLWRKDVFAIGGNDEEFVEPCWDDDWFADMLIKGHGIEIRYTDYPTGWHQSHPHPVNSHAKEWLSAELYQKKVASGTWRNSAPPWPYREESSEIPKRMSFFWGGDSLSWLRWQTIESFRRFNPDWEIRLYRPDSHGEARWTTGERVDSETSVNCMELLEPLGVRIVPWHVPVPNVAYPHASDLCQWEMLGSAGGFYADMDILWLQSMDKLYQSVRTLDAMFCMSIGFMTIGFFGAVPNCRIFQDAYAEARHGKHSVYQSTGAEAFYRMAGLAKTWNQTQSPGLQVFSEIRRRYPEYIIGQIPPGTVYPFNWQQVDGIFERSIPLDESVIGLHWFGGNPIAQKWNNLLTEDNWRGYNNTLCRALKKAIG